MLIRENVSLLIQECYNCGCQTESSKNGINWLSNLPEQSDVYCPADCNHDCEVDHNHDGQLHDSSD